LIVDDDDSSFEHSFKKGQRAPAAELFYFSAFLENLWRSLRKINVSRAALFERLHLNVGTNILTSFLSLINRFSCE